MVKQVFDRVLAVCPQAPDIEFAWVGDDGVDPLEQAQTISILVGAGIKTIAEARVELGLVRAKGVAKFNPNHDERGRFATAEGAVEPGVGSRPEDHARVAASQGAKPNGFQALYEAPLASRAYHAAVQAAHDVVLAAEDAGASAAGGLFRGIVASTAATAALASAALLAMTSSTGAVQQGVVPDRPDISYRWAQDEASVTFSVQSGAQTQTLHAQQNSAGDFIDGQGNVLATVESGPNGQRGLLVDPDAVDAAIVASAGAGSSHASSGVGAPDDLQVQYYNPKTRDVTFAPAGAPPPGYVPVSGTAGDGIGAPATSDERSSQPSLNSIRPLANGQNAIIAPDKIFGYALNPDHERGGDKATVFNSALGFNLSKGARLVAAISQGILTAQATPTISNKYGQQFRVDMPVTGPNGKTRILLTIWNYAPGSENPSLPAYT